MQTNIPDPRFINTSLVLENVSLAFKDLVMQIHELNEKGVKGETTLQFSGKKNTFTFYFTKMDSNEIRKLKNKAGCM